LAQQRREHSRVRFGGRVSCIPSADVEEQFCQGCNISQGGALLRTVAGPRPALGSMVELRLEAEELGPLPAIDGEVVRHDADDGLFAVRFVNLDAPRRAIIRRVMAAGSDELTDREAVPDDQAGTYAVTARSSRKITQIYGEGELSDLKQASREAAAERRDHRDMTDGEYSSIEDAVRGASAEHVILGARGKEGKEGKEAKVPIMAISVDAVPWHRLDPLAAVILSKVDGRATFGEILATAQIGQPRAWELVTLLLEQGIIRERG